MSGDPRAGEVAAELAYPRPIATYHDERAAKLLVCADSADRAAGIYRVSLDAAIEAAAKAACAAAWLTKGWDACEVKDDHRNSVRALITAAVMGGAQ